MNRRLLLFGILSAITLVGMLYVQFAPQDPPTPTTGYVVIREGGDSRAQCQQEPADGPSACLTEVTDVVSVPLPYDSPIKASPGEARRAKAN